MMWAEDYPLGTVMLGVFDVWLWVAHESINAELFYMLY